MRFIDWLRKILGGGKPTNPPAPPPPTPPPSGDFVTRLLAAHNSPRQQQQRYPLSLHPILSRTAQDWAVKMAAEDHLYHGDPFARIYAAGFVGECSENIAWGQTIPEECVNDWMADFGHRANVLSTKWAHVGFGVAAARNGRLYWVADYGV